MYIESFTGSLRYLDDPYDIKMDLNHPDLIISGLNGSGKTIFLEQNFQLLLTSLQRGQEISGIKFYNFDEVNRLRGMFSIKYFNATRILQIPSDTHRKGFDKIQAANKQSIHNNSVNISNEFHNHIIALRGYRNSERADNIKSKIAENIDKWFDQLNKDFAKLFEDETVKLIYDNLSAQFHFEQEERENYTFQNLSSGHQAALHIYFELLQRQEGLTPDKFANPESAQILQGIVFIDEIELHFHQSLEQKMFKFLKSVFPKMQFIVSTHSENIVTTNKRLPANQQSIIYDFTERKTYTTDDWIEQHKISFW